MTLLPGAHHKIAPQTFEGALRKHGIGNVHHMTASAISLTQATEAGVVYEPAEIQQLSAIARKAGMKVHLDGARLANAMVHLGLTPAEMTWKAGVDILTFGTTKNGTMNAEAVITFDPEVASRLRVMHKRAGHLFSKMRYLSVQLLSYLADGLWHRNASQANRNAARILAALKHCPGVEVGHPVHVNEVFAILPPILIEALRDKGIHLRRWKLTAAGQEFRLVTSYCDDPGEIQLLEEACGSVLASRRTEHGPAPGGQL
jgi:threonine aldolase